MKHPIATPLVLLTAAVTCLALARPSHPHAFTVLGAIGTLLLIAGVVLLLIRLFIALGRFLRRCYREIMDNVWIARRGVLNPEQVHQEFVITMGREPTIAEVHDLHDMIKTEHNQAVARLLAIAAGIVGSAILWHRALRGKGF